MEKEKDLVDRMAERIRTSELGVFVDMNDIDRLVETAVEKAFFEPRVESGGYSSSSTKRPPVVVEMARDSFDQEVRDAVKPIVEKLVSEPAFMKLVIEGVVMSIPAAADRAAQSLMYGALKVGGEQYPSHLRDELIREVEGRARSYGQ